MVERRRIVVDEAFVERERHPPQCLDFINANKYDDMVTKQAIGFRSVANTHHGDQIIKDDDDRFCARKATKGVECEPKAICQGIIKASKNENDATNERLLQLREGFGSR